MPSADTSRLTNLANRIRGELTRVSDLVAELESAIPMLHGEPSVIEINGCAALVENFYSLIEKVFERIATAFEGAPDGESWHRELLDQMSRETPERPRVIAPERMQALNEYLGFRHLRRNLYLMDLDLSRLRPLVENVGSAWGPLRADLEDFAGVLDQMAAALQQGGV